VGRSKKKHNVGLLQTVGRIENRPLFFLFMGTCIVLFSCDHAIVHCFVKPLAVDVSLYIYTLLGTHARALMYVSSCQSSISDS